MSDKSKKIKVAETEQQQQQDEKLVHSFKKLQETQDELEKINDEVSEKLLEVVQKYRAIRKRVYEKRNEIIQSIPDFWLNAFVSHPALGTLLNEEDQKIFNYLDSLEVEDRKDVKSGYTIILKFKSNPYFENSKLVKTINFLDDVSMRVTGTTICWKEGKGLPNGDESENKGKKRSLIKDSFFSWFCDREKIHEAKLHDEIADLIKEDFWTNPLTYFNNEADEEDSEDNDEENDGEGSDDGKEDDGDGDD